MSSNTLRWIVRIGGLAMLIVFAYLLCSMQNQLARLQQDRRVRPGGPAREGPPPAEDPEAPSSR